MNRFFSDRDRAFAAFLPQISLSALPDPMALAFSDRIAAYEVHAPTADNAFLHEAAIIEYHGTLFASWYNCEIHELHGRTPIRGRRSDDGGRTWSDIEVIADDPTGKILYCPPIYGICEDRLYLLLNEMVGPDRIHALDCYLYDEETGTFRLLWSRPIPFKLNTNVVTLPDGRLMLPGRIAELDGFPNTPAVLLSDSGKIDAEWRLVRIAEDGNLPNGTKLVHPELCAIVHEGTIYMFSRDDENRVPLVYLSHDFGETWSTLHTHDIPFSNSKIYSGTLANGRHYLIGNLLPDRRRLAIYFSRPGEMRFDCGYLLQDNRSFGDYNGCQWSYPVAYEANGKLYVIYSAESDAHGKSRGAALSVIPTDIGITENEHSQGD